VVNEEVVLSASSCECFLRKLFCQLSVVKPAIAGFFASKKEQPVEKYLYLAKREWMSSWVHGGVIPINLASTYLREQRGTIYTPDETVIHDSTVDLGSIPGIYLENARHMTLRGNTVIEVGTFFGKRTLSVKTHRPVVDGSFYSEDGIILSFCNTASAAIMKRLGKACCVKILDVSTLKKIIDTQLGVEGSMKNCSYTDDHQRNHFLKSVEDCWQDEFRMFWVVNANKQVTLPPDIAVPVEL
jgi:hypothetical protein